MKNRVTTEEYINLVIADLAPYEDDINTERCKNVSEVTAMYLPLLQSAIAGGLQIKDVFRMMLATKEYMDLIIEKRKDV